MGIFDYVHFEMACPNCGKPLGDHPGCCGYGEGGVMGITKHRGTMPGAVTPICNDCGVSLCWDIAEEEADRDRAFWDAWICQDCNGGKRMSLKEWASQRSATTRLISDSPP